MYIWPPENLNTLANVQHCLRHPVSTLLSINLPPKAVRCTKMIENDYDHYYLQIHTNQIRSFKNCYYLEDLQGQGYIKTIKSSVPLYRKCIIKNTFESTNMFNTVSGIVNIRTITWLYVRSIVPFEPLTTLKWHRCIGCIACITIYGQRYI